jgi:iron complex transport system substrate-binding protein
MRIASLLPSATEIVYELGLGDELVAISHDCDYPPEVTKKIQLTKIDIDPSRSTSQQINQWVTSTVHAGTSLYHIDPTNLARANPDLILTQELCEVCAPAFSEVKEACRVLNGGRKIISLEPTSLDQILENILTVGEATGRLPEARGRVTALRERIERIKTASSDVKHRPEVLCVEWFDPLYAAGHWIPEMVYIAGGIDKLGRLHQPSERIQWEQVAIYDPEMIVLMPCGFNLKRTSSESDVLKSSPAWAKLKAVKNGQVYAANGTAYFNRPGPRIIGGLEGLAELIHPEIFTGIAPKDSYSKLELSP